MNHQYIEVDNLKIAYVEKNKDAVCTIFFIHGNSCSSRLWYKQFASPVLSKYRLVAFDMPGHGQSDAVKNVEDYNLLFFGDIMAKAVNALAGNSEYILAGFSFGANVIAEMIGHSLSPKGLVIISPTIVGGEYTLKDTLKPGADASILFTDEPPQDKLSEFYQNILLSNDKTDFSICIEDFNAVKKPFRSMVLKTAVEGKLSNEIENVIRYNVSLLLVFGNEDKIVNTEYLNTASLPLWNNAINKLDGAGHFVMLDQPEAFNDLLTDYCKQIF